MQVDSEKVNNFLKRIRVYIARMPSLSTTVTKVLETCNDPYASANDLSRVISLDPVLVGQVLRLINSAYYALPHAITSLPRAIIMLGLNTVKNLALSLAVLETMNGKGTMRTVSSNDFWAHSLCVGVSARCISELRGASLSEREDYFIAGLLHDLGKIPLNKQFPEQYYKAFNKANSDSDPQHLFEAENEIFGINHCVVGQLIAEKWQLGGTLVQSLAHHHCADDTPPNTQTFVAVVALANACAKRWRIGYSGDSIEDDNLLSELLEQVDMESAALNELQEHVLEEIEKAKIFLEISRRE
jgi:HD-like signal output (HDOD) protein